MVSLGRCAALVQTSTTAFNASIMLTIGLGSIKDAFLVSEQTTALNAFLTKTAAMGISAVGFTTVSLIISNVVCQSDF